MRRYLNARRPVCQTIRAMFAGQELYTSDQGVRKAFTSLSCAFEKKVGLAEAKTKFVKRIMKLIPKGHELFGDKQLIADDYLIKAAFNDYFDVEAKAKKDYDEGHGLMRYKDLVEMGRETLLQALDQAVEDGVGFGVVRRPDRKRKARAAPVDPDLEVATAVGVPVSAQLYADLDAGEVIEIVTAYPIPNPAELKKKQAPKQRKPAKSRKSA